MIKYVFDVDGTLTPSRGKMDKEFQKFFLNFCNDNDVYLVTGSDYAKTVEQVGNDIVMAVKKVYNCSGSDVYEKGQNIRTSDWTMPTALKAILLGWLQASPFTLRTGNHIEERPGMVNFSIVGRNCSYDERQLYIKHDTDNRERETVAFQINSAFEDITATVGGETGIDIGPVGADKSQILKDFEAEHKIYFYGDRIDQGGNDYPLAAVNVSGKNFNVKDWRNTWRLLDANTNNWS